MSESAHEDQSTTHTKQANRVAEAPKSNDRTPPKFATEKVPVRMIDHKRLGDLQFEVAFNGGRSQGVYPDMKLRLLADNTLHEIKRADEGTCWIVINNTLDYVLSHRNAEVVPVPKQKLPLPKKR